MDTVKNILKRNFYVLTACTISMPLFAIDDYRCVDKPLCEDQHYTEVSGIDDAFTQGKVEGRLRLAYIDQNNHQLGASDTYATSVGGELKYETAKLYHISLAAAAFISEKVSVLSGDEDRGELNGDFFDADKDSFAYLGEAYIDYGYKSVDLRIGRQKIDTPMNDRDDIRILPNSFEAIMAGYGGIKETVLTAGYVRRMAGYDSGDDISEFKDVPGVVDATGNVGEGFSLLGVINESFENTEAQVWYYGFDKLADVLYLDAVYGVEYEGGIGTELAFQYANYAEKSSSTIEGDVYGGKLFLGYGDMTIGAAFSRVEASDGKNITIGFGGGPYWTSMEEWTIDGMNDGEAYVLGAEFDLSKIVNGLGLAYAYGKFNGNAQTAADSSKVEENDMVLNYAIAENTELEVSYAYVDDKANSGTADVGYDRLLVRGSYNF